MSSGSPGWRARSRTSACAGRRCATSTAIVHTVPNGEIKVASNLTRVWARINQDVTVAHGTDVDKAIDVVDRVGQEMADDPVWRRRILERPRVERVEAIGEYGITLKLLGSVRAGEQWATAGELRKRLLAAFHENGIEIPRPQRVVLSRDPDAAGVRRRAGARTRAGRERDRSTTGPDGTGSGQAGRSPGESGGPSTGCVPGRAVHWPFSALLARWHVGDPVDGSTARRVARRAAPGRRPAARVEWPGHRRTHVSVEHSASHEIENLLAERRTYPPSPEFAAQANARAELYEEAERDFEGFWANLARERISWSKPFDTTLEWDLPFAKWFTGGELNVAYNCVDRHVENGLGDKVAYHWIGEPGDTRTLTFADLKREVSKAANALKELGVEKGDRVAIYMPMIPELPIAMLACARIGAPHTVVFGGFSAESLSAGASTTARPRSSSPRMAATGAATRST